MISDQTSFGRRSGCRWSSISNSAQQTSSITLPYRSRSASRGSAASPSQRRCQAGSVDVPAEDVGGAPRGTRRDDIGYSTEGRSRARGRPPPAAWPLSWRSSCRLPRPPSAYVAKTHGGRRATPVGGAGGRLQPGPDRERHGDDRATGPWQDVVADAEVGRVRAERRQVGLVQRQQLVLRDTRRPVVARRRPPRTGSPRAPVRPDP